jgi:triphosphatase
MLVLPCNPSRHTKVFGNTIDFVRDAFISLVTQTETELKFMVPARRLEALVTDMRQRKVRVQRLLAIYYDTVDDRLAASNVSVRLRREGRRWVQTAKAPTADPLRRLEHNVVLTVPRTVEAPAVDLGLHDGTPAGLAIRNALGISDAKSATASLVERFRTEVSRLTQVEEFEGACVELALDSGKIVAGKRSMAICELEMELKSGPMESLFRLAAQRASPHGLWLSSVSKARRGMRLATGDAVDAVSAEVLSVDTHSGEERFFVEVVESCLRQILGNASEICAGAADEELVHQLRVGLRRLRTALRELGSFAGGLDPAWEKAFRAAFQALGAHRDEVTVLPAFRKEMARAGLECPVALAAVSVAPSPEAVVQSPEFQHALLDVMSFCYKMPAKSDLSGARRRLKQRVGSRLALLYKNMKRDAKHFNRLPSSRQHRVRKRLKRLRYLAEFSSPLFGTRRVGRYLKQWREAQDALGDQNDQRVGFDSLLDASSGVASKHMKRWISSRLSASVKRSDSALRKALKGGVIWKENR